MKVVYIVTSNGLAPLNDNDRDNHSRLTVGNLYQKNFKKVRNSGFHRLVFDYLNAVFCFQSNFDDFEKFRKRIKLLIGDVEEDIRITGEPRDHFRVIPLCYLHHQGECGIHEKGKKEWRKIYGHELELLKIVKEKLCR